MMTMPLDELRALLARHARPDLSTDIEAVRIFRADRPTPPTPTTYSKVLAVVAQGVKRFALGDRVYEHRAGEYVIASVDLPVTAQFLRAGPEEPALGFGLDLRPAWPSAPRPPNCSTPSSVSCGCSIGPATSPCSRP